MRILCVFISLVLCAFVMAETGDYAQLPVPAVFEQMDWLEVLFKESPWYVLVGSGLVGLHFLALFIVNMTPTPADNTFYGWFYKWVLEKLLAWMSEKAKEKPSANK